MPRSSIRAGISTGLLVLVAACGDGTPPSTFGNGGGSEGGATDGSTSDTGSFGMSNPGDFDCAGATCTRHECYPLGNCGDCNCVMQMVSVAQCAGDRVTCTPMAPYTVSCTPGGEATDSGAPADSGAGG